MPLFTVCLFIVYIIHTSHLVYLNLHFFTFQDFRWRFKGTDRLCKVVELSMHWKHMHTKVRFWTSTLRSNSGFTDPYKVLYVSNESKRICLQHCILSSTTFHCRSVLLRGDCSKRNLQEKFSICNSTFCFNNSMEDILFLFQSVLKV